ncbi:FAD dependent oxidoreductase [Seiridium cupressi]
MNDAKTVGVLGAGVVGLACALSLTDAGYRAVIVARDFPGDYSHDWASPWAGALLAPHPSGDHEMQKKSLDFYKSQMHVEQNGICELKITEYYDDRNTNESIWYKYLFPDFRWLPRSSLPPHAKIGFTYTGMAVDPANLLPWMVKKLKQRDVQFKRYSVESIDMVRTLTGADLVVNASGLGAGELSGDSAVEPIRGQTMFVSIPHERSFLCDQAFLFQGSEYSYAIPRRSSGGIVLGGVSQHGSVDCKIQAGLRDDIKRRVNAISDDAFGWLDVSPGNVAIKDIVGFRPGRKGGIRVERVRNTVHAYGAGGLGYVYAFGMAARVRDLVEKHRSSKP